MCAQCMKTTTCCEFRRMRSRTAGWVTCCETLSAIDGWAQFGTSGAVSPVGAPFPTLTDELLSALRTTIRHPIYKGMVSFTLSRKETEDPNKLLPPCLTPCEACDKKSRLKKFPGLPTGTCCNCGISAVGGR